MASIRYIGALMALAMPLATAPVGAAPDGADGSFTVAVIPDTQNYLDYSHQTEEGFPFDAREIFYDQMGYIAQHAASQGGDIAFAVAVGGRAAHDRPG